MYYFLITSTKSLLPYYLYYFLGFGLIKYFLKFLGSNKSNKGVKCRNPPTQAHNSPKRLPLPIVGGEHTLRGGRHSAVSVPSAVSTNIRPHIGQLLTTFKIRGAEVTRE